MNKHEEAREDLKKIHQHCEHYYNANLMNLLPMENVIKYTVSCEATEKAYEDTKYNLSVIKGNALKLQNELVELKRDVKRYFELKIKKDMVINEYKMLSLLYDKLSKVGNE